MSKTHPWKEKGLGSPPFQFYKFERQDQISTICDVCGRGIKKVYWIKDTFGASFKTGSECISKSESIYSKLTEDAQVAKKAAQTVDVALRVAKAKTAIDGDPTFLTDERSPYRSDKTLREWATFALANGGQRKQLEVCRAIEAYAAKRQLR